MIIKASKAEYLFLVLFLLFAVLFTTKIIKDKQYKDSLEHFIGEGASMEPTILNGEEIIADPNRKPEINDIIVFGCDKCKISEKDVDSLTKRLLKKNKEGCYWVEGDNKVKSYDSRDFGWLCPGEIDFYGVVLNKD